MYWSLSASMTMAALLCQQYLELDIAPYFKVSLLRHLALADGCWWCLTGGCCIRLMLADVSVFRWMCHIPPVSE